MNVEGPDGEAGSGFRITRLPEKVSGHPILQGESNLSQGCRDPRKGLTEKPSMAPD